MESRDLRNLLEELKDKEYRHVFASSVLDTSIAAQIRANREAQRMSQQELAEASEMKQSRISTMEDINYGSWTIKTLKRLAEALDLRLVVRFESFSSLVKGIRTNGELTSFEQDLVRPRFSEDDWNPPGGQRIGRVVSSRAGETIRRESTTPPFPQYFRVSSVEDSAAHTLRGVS